jgi:hypothetical protein
MKVKIINMFLVMAITLSGCIFRNNKNTENSTDSFYKRISGWDYTRIPLKKPFELLKMKGETEWSLNTDTQWIFKTSDKSFITGAIYPVTLIYCDCDGIFGHADSHQSPMSKVLIPEFWFFLDLHQDTVFSFEKESEFDKKFIDKKKLMKSPETIFNEFKNKESLIWCEE